MEYIIIIAIVILLSAYFCCQHYGAKWRSKREREIDLELHKRREEWADVVAQTNALTRDDWRVNDNCN